MTLLATSARAMPTETTVAATSVDIARPTAGDQFGEGDGAALAAERAVGRGREASRFNVLAHDEPEIESLS